MYKLRTHVGTLQFATLDAVKTYMGRLYQQGAIRNGHIAMIQCPDGGYTSLHLSFGVVMETRF